MEIKVQETMDMQSGIVQYYDALIEEENDPVRDSEPMQAYMNKWDGVEFVEKMRLDERKSVLEIGVGTGRLAVRVAPLCGRFYGIDISPKTIRRAEENLAEMRNVTLLCGDFLSYEFNGCFDVIYSSLTFMHIQNKREAVKKVAGLLCGAGRFVLSIDKNQSDCIDTGRNKIKVYPDMPDAMAGYIEEAGMTVAEQYDMEFATIFVALK